MSKAQKVGLDPSCLRFKPMMLFLVVGVLGFKSRIGKQCKKVGVILGAWNLAHHSFSTGLLWNAFFFILLAETVFRKNTEFNLLKNWKNKQERTSSSG